MVIAGMVDSEEHKQAAAFSDIYAVQPTEYSVLVHKDSKYASAKCLADFSEASLLGQKGTKLDANMYAETGKSILEQCERLGCKPFHLVSITRLRWDEELSPWEYAPVVSQNDHFTGKADLYAQCMEKQIIPFI
ncbi:MAG: hypothetical protein HDT47_04430 [Ruminococcaceae bacterium]|nr:hypothetical protein [Oscillospiraceae bacterium]